MFILFKREIEGDFHGISRTTRIAIVRIHHERFTIYQVYDKATLVAGSNIYFHQLHIAIVQTTYSHFRSFYQLGRTVSFVTMTLANKQ